MKTRYTLPLSDAQATLAIVGGKGASLSLLVEAGLPVPGGFHVITEAYRQFVASNALQPVILEALELVDTSQPKTLDGASRIIFDLFTNAHLPKEIASAVVQAYAALPGRSPAVAVRSSATAEDLPEASFAGQQDTFLNISGPEAVLEAVHKCWASLWTARAIGYRARQNIDPEGVALAVVVQLLVPAEAAGILFTANPINGNREELLINASWGLGEAVVGGVVSPDTINMDKSSGAVIHRETADKLVQTVRTNSGTEEIPVPESLRNVPVLSDAQSAALAGLGVQIEKLYDRPMDIEWTLTDGEFAIVQARPITAFPEPPIQWSPPHPKGTYMRASVVDLMPDPLSPLFISLGIPSFRKQMQPLGKRLVGSEPAMADDYFTSINTYAYMNHAIPLKGLWWALTGLLPAYPRLLGRLVPVWRDELHPEYQAFVAGMEGKQPSKMSAQELWVDAQRIVDAATYYICGLMFATMGASAGSEGLLTKVYEKLAQRDGDPPAATLLMGWDNIAVRAEKARYDLAMWCKDHPALDAYIQVTPAAKLAEQLREDPVPVDVMETDWRDFQNRFNQHLQQYGHIIYQMDFAHDLPLDHPEPMLETVKMYLRGEGTNPHDRQRASEEKRIQTTETMLNRLKGPKLWVFKWALNWGQTMAEVREDALAEIGLGYPILRAMLRELGHRFSAHGVIHHQDDIFWLEKEEIDALVAALDSGQDLQSLTGQVEDRKAFYERVKAETPPPMMPVKERIMGIKTDTFIAHSAEMQTGDTLKGVATSAGKTTATARVLLSPEDFDQMRPGDILVAGITTPAWTPLFSMASAVVTDIGGPLSHGSIVAREFGIPAVMGTGVATKRIQSGQTLIVDGNEGTVTILNGNEV
jgi:pyruvate,water dikinase